MHVPDPYKAPSSAISPQAPNQFSQVKIFSAHGRIGRLRYFGYSVATGMLINILVAMVLPFQKTLESSGNDILLVVLAVALLVVVVLGLVIYIFLMVQRLHDFNARGWWSLLTLVPLANLVLALALLIMPGTQGENRFGYQPPPNTLGVILLGLIVPLIAVVGIIAAIAIPSYQKYAHRAAQAEVDATEQRSQQSPPASDAPANESER